MRTGPNSSASGTQKPIARIAAACASTLLPLASRLGPQWLERAEFLVELMEEARWRQVAELTLGGPPRIAARALRRRQLAAKIRANPDARALDSRCEFLDAAGTIRRHTLGLETAPLVSVVIPCYNYGRFIEDALNSVRAQTIAPVETIIVDDGSTQAETIAVLDALTLGPHEHLLRQANAGLPNARNAGIAKATGQFICCLDADDRLAPRYLEMAITALELDPAAGFAYSTVQLFGDEDRLWRTKPFDLLEMLRNNHVAVSAVFRRTDWQLVGGYSPAMVGGYEDWAFWLALAAIGRRGKHLNEPLFQHRKHGRTMTAEAHERRAELLARMRQGRPELFASSKALARRVAFNQAPSPTLARAMSPVVSAWVAPPAPAKSVLTIVAPHLMIGGADAILRDIAAHLSPTCDIEVLTTLPGADHTLQHAFTPHVSKVIHLPDIAAPSVWLDHFVARMERRTCGTVLSCGSTFLYQNAANLRARLPNLRWLDIVHTDRREGHLAAAMAASPSIDLHIAGARKTFEAMAAHGVPESRRTLIENGIDPERFNPDKIDKGAARKALGLPDDGFVIGYIGRLSREKRPQVAARLASLAARAGQVHFLMVGEGPLAQTTLSKAPPSTIWHPRLKEDAQVAAAYRALDVLLLPSAVEAMPLSLLEAMAMGVPVLSTRVGDIADAIQDGVSGTLAPVDDPMALAAPLLAMVREPQIAHQQGQAARARFKRSDWTKEQMLNRYESVLRLSQAPAEPPPI